MNIVLLKVVLLLAVASSVKSFGPIEITTQRHTNIYKHISLKRFCRQVSTSDSHCSNSSTRETTPSVRTPSPTSKSEISYQPSMFQHEPEYKSKHDLEHEHQSKPHLESEEPRPRPFRPWPLNTIRVPRYLDGSLAGDLGFDPLRIARDQEGLFFFREAEIKHARIAMLAALGKLFCRAKHHHLSLSFPFHGKFGEILKFQKLLYF